MKTQPVGSEEGPARLAKVGDGHSEHQREHVIWAHDQISMAKVPGVFRVEQRRLKQQVLRGKRHSLVGCNRASPVVLKTTAHRKVLIHVHGFCPSTYMRTLFC